ncbi:MAG: crosslink repair DNA glycosylase YcaQ family protein [Acidimicrobiales bacterium]
MPEPEISLSAREARRIALAAQSLLGPRLGGGPTSMLGRLRAVQLDTISVLARSHELVTFARLGPMPRARIDEEYWGPASATFEYWSHAACILPLEDWPAYGFRRRALIARGHRWHRLEDADKSCSYVRNRLRSEGPLSARELGGAKRGGPWWDWTETKIAAERLLDIGELVCRRRKGFQRVYDLAERAIPAELLGTELSDEACHVRLVEAAAGALGVATAGDLAAYHGLTRPQVERALTRTALLPAKVEGWNQPAFTSEAGLGVLGRRMRGRAVLVSPFDSLTWYRERTERLFGFRHRLEAYVPRDKRVHGYFSMPVLGGDRLVGLVDPGRRGHTLVARHVSLETRDAASYVATALVEAAAWVDTDNIVVERVTPDERTSELCGLVAAAQS